MISEKRLEANRRNAQHSTGPKTPEGKARSSRNNLRHGLTGQITVLPDEDRDAHDAFCHEIVTSLKPETPIELQLAQSIAEDSWRLNRAVAIETNIFALGHDHKKSALQIALADARTFQERAAQFNLLSLYEQRINRNRQRNLNQLRELQAERREQQAKATQEKAASAVSQPQLAANPDGFEFSHAATRQTASPDTHSHAARPPESQPSAPPETGQYETAHAA